MDCDSPSMNPRSASVVTSMAANFQFFARYGMAGMSTTDKNGLDLKLAWPSAEWGSLPVEGGVAAAFKREIQGAADPLLRQRELEEELRALASPFRTAEAFGVEDVIDPRQTRRYLCRFIDAVQGRMKADVGPKANPAYLELDDLVECIG